MDGRCRGGVRRPPATQSDCTDSVRKRDRERRGWNRGGPAGRNVSIRNEATGLELTAVTDESGTYTIRNITGGTYTLRATLHGFKEFVQTGIPVTAGGIVRINGRLEIGALSESVTVTTEAAVLKTDKADVSVDLKPADVVNLPLNQYRNYQYLMNLVPGATPPVFQNAQTDTPGRALSTNINGTNRNNNVTRIDGAASINVWLPHHAGYIAPVETIENVNISTNSFDAAQGMTGGAATAVQTKSGSNTLKGSAFYFRQQDEFNARRGYFDPSKVDASTAILGGTVGGPIRRNKLFYFGSWERNSERQGLFSTYTVPTAKMRVGDFSEVLALNPAFRIYDPATGTSDGRNRTFFPGAVIPADRISDIAQEIQAVYPAPNNPGTNNGLQNNLFLPRQPKADRDNYDGKVNWNRDSAASDLGQVLDDAGGGLRPVLPRPGWCRGREDEHEDLYRGPDLDAQPDAPLRCERRCEYPETAHGGTRFRHQLRH